ncbi:MAG: hypothetical protein CVU42_09530 [Chloroflexi bacterium HGW-Chloroflexi-4]|nr:MAG: hypothetical protein CVU42_09530 [Chloroflexi bacterium HGW-Chloroflexi-4]
MTTDENKLEILRKVENGTLSIEEGAELIGILEGAKSEPEPQRVGSQSGDMNLGSMSSTDKHEVSGCWKAAWSMFLVGGAILTGFSAYWIYQGYTNKGLGWGFWLSWIPMLIGIGLMIFGWALMDSPWMHVKVHSEKSGNKGIFIFSMPVPFNIARWVMQNFGQYMPDEVKSHEILDVLDQAESSIKRGEPFQVQVDDENDGTKVDIVIN